MATTSAFCCFFQKCKAGEQWIGGGGHLVNLDERLKAVIGDAGSEGLQALLGHLEGDHRVSPGRSSQGEHAYASPNVHQYL